MKYEDAKRTRVKFDKNSNRRTTMFELFYFNNASWTTNMSGLFFFLNASKTTTVSGLLKMLEEQQPSLDF